MRYSFVTLAVSTASSTNYEQMASIFKIVSIVLFSLAAVCLLLAVFTFIIFKIPNVIGDLTGRNARKSIEKMRDANEKSGKKSYRPHPVASDRGTLTEPIKQSKKESKKLSETVKTEPQRKESQTFDGNSATDVLEDLNATAILDYDSNGTEILSGGTEVLSEETMRTTLNENTVKIKMIQDIILIHTEEVI
ncbi:MAG: hypothetical protein KIG53_00825 [Oscillospiraceae bacterium]|nr:hypothetical protein [Oscillospiraceae bacterium]